MSQQQENVTADQQSQNKTPSYKECEKCKAEGKPLQMIRFEKAGMRGDGGIIWKIWNPDGTEHTNHPFTAKKEWKRSVWAVRGIRSGDESQVNQWLREAKDKKDGYFDILGYWLFWRRWTW